MLARTVYIITENIAVNNCPGNMRYIAKKKDRKKFLVEEFHISSIHKTANCFRKK